jgi:hypothetical protein
MYGILCECKAMMRGDEAMGFMQEHIEFGTWYAVEGDNGTDYIPADVVDGARADRWISSESPWAIEKLARIFGDYTQNREIRSVERVQGYGARLSAPGYMDCTEWAVFETEGEAAQYLADAFGDDDEGAE